MPFSSSRPGARAGSRSRHADALPDKQQQLQAATVAPPATGLTTAQGLAYPDNHHSLKAGPRGPTLVQDFILREKLHHFAHERIPERVVNARGAGAHGTFQVYKALSEYTTAQFLNDTEARTPVFVRFSTMTGPSGSADTVRDVRGFAVKFYTPEGNFDLVGASMPVFFVQDAMKFPDLVHAMKGEPHHGMPTASTAHDTFWDFCSLMPETTHMLMWTMSDRALPRSWRMMEGFGVHTFRLCNARGESTLAKFHWKPRLGLHALAQDEARKLAGEDPDFHRRDLWEAIGAGHFPEWELGLQLVPEDKADALGIDLLDATKLIPEEVVPVTPVGRLVLHRNPDNAFAETEQAAFHPGHLVPGVDLVADPLLQGRLLAYTDAQAARLGGPNAQALPINRPVCPLHNFQRDGAQRHAIDRGAVAYEPNSLASSTGVEFRVDGGQHGFKSHASAIGSPVERRRPASFDDHFTQAALYWNSMAAPEKEHIVAAFRQELGRVRVPAIRQRMVDNLAHVDARLARRVAAGLGSAAPDPRAAAGQAGFRGARAEGALERSAALSMAARVPAAGQPPEKAALATRRVALLAADGVDGVTLRAALQALQEAGLDCRVVAPRLGAVTTAGNRRLQVDTSFEAMPSVLFDAVLVVGGGEGVQALRASGEAMHFVLEAYKHAKPLCALGEGAALLEAVGVAPGTAPDALAASHPGVVLGAGDAESLPATVQAFLEAIARHRHWERANLEAVAA